MNILRQGYFREMPHGEETDPSITEEMNRMDSGIIKNVCNYLNNGIEIITCAGTVMDVINPKKGIAGIPSVCTDGTWYWSGDLSYYVKNYRIALPDEFVNTMKENGWMIPITAEDLNFDDLSLDGAFVSRE